MIIFDEVTGEAYKNIIGIGCKFQNHPYSMLIVDDSIFALREENQN